MSQNISVGVGVYILNDNNELLLGLRKSKHGSNSWCPPGGLLEYGEEFAEAALRETKEETGLDIKVADISIIGVTNDLHKSENRHGITIHTFAKNFNGIAHVAEPDKHKEWKWFSLDKLPENMFLPVAIFLQKNNLLDCIE